MPLSAVASTLTVQHFLMIFTMPILISELCVLMCYTQKAKIGWNARLYTKVG